VAVLYRRRPWRCLRRFRPTGPLPGPLIKCPPVRAIELWTAKVSPSTRSDRREALPTCYASDHWTKEPAAIELSPQGIFHERLSEEALLGIGCQCGGRQRSLRSATTCGLDQRSSASHWNSIVYKPATGDGVAFSSTFDWTVLGCECFGW